MNQSINDLQMKLNLQGMKTQELLLAHAALVEELRNRQVIRTSNNPVADYSEWLVANTLKFTLVQNSSAGFDAYDESGNRVQIKGRRRTSHNQSVQLGAIRNLASKPFDYLIGVIFCEDYSIDYVARIPYDVIVEKSKFRSHTNSYIFHLRRTIFDDTKVKELTGMFK